MMLTKNFSLDEFTLTRHVNIDNTLPPEMMAHALTTAQMLEKIRTHLSTIYGSPVPIVITSGYRCKRLNDAVGSNDSSHHLLAAAADWTAPKFGTPYEICKNLAPQVSSLGIGQLIHEYGQWIHTSWMPPKNVVNRIITISKAGTFAGIRRV